MNTLNFRLSGGQILRNSIFLVSFFLLSGTALADRPDWSGGGDRDGESEHKNKHKHKHGKGGDKDRDDDDRRESRHQELYQSNRGNIEIRIGGYFGDTQRSEAQEYYKKRSRAGHCPPGLAKKNNGCTPPGHARQWAMGERLSREVTYKAIDPAIQIKLGMPPEGHKFVRVATDILLIAVGTGMVVDAIQDLGQ